MLCDISESDLTVDTESVVLKIIFNPKMFVFFKFSRHVNVITYMS